VEHSGSFPFRTIISWNLHPLIFNRETQKDTYTHHFTRINKNYPGEYASTLVGAYSKRRIREILPDSNSHRILPTHGWCRNNLFEKRRKTWKYTPATKSQLAPAICLELQNSGKITWRL